MDSESLFEILIRENTEMLVAFLRSGVRDEQVVDDLYQETVLVAWKRLDDYDRDAPIGPWLRGIAGKIMLAHYRKSRRNPVPLDEQSLDWLNTRFEAIHALRGDTFHQKLATLRACMDALPDTYKRPLTLRFTEDRPLVEVEKMLNVARETLKKRLARGKQRLAECLERKLGLGVQA